MARNISILLACSIAFVPHGSAAVAVSEDRLRDILAIGTTERMMLEALRSRDREVLEQLGAALRDTYGELLSGSELIFTRLVEDGVVYYRMDFVGLKNRERARLLCEMLDLEKCLVLGEDRKMMLLETRNSGTVTALGVVHDDAQVMVMQPEAKPDPNPMAADIEARMRRMLDPLGVTPVRRPDALPPSDFLPKVPEAMPTSDAPIEPEANPAKDEPLAARKSIDSQGAPVATAVFAPDVGRDTAPVAEATTEIITADVPADVPARDAAERGVVTVHEIPGFVREQMDRAQALEAARANSVSLPSLDGTSEPTVLDVPDFVRDQMVAESEMIEPAVPAAVEGLPSVPATIEIEPEIWESLPTFKASKEVAPTDTVFAPKVDWAGGVRGRVSKATPAEEIATEEKAGGLPATEIPTPTPTPTQAKDPELADMPNVLSGPLETVTPEVIEDDEDSEGAEDDSDDRGAALPESDPLTPKVGVERAAEGVFSDLPDVVELAARDASRGESIKHDTTVDDVVRISHPVPAARPALLGVRMHAGAMPLRRPVRVEVLVAENEVRPVPVALPLRRSDVLPATDVRLPAPRQLALSVPAADAARLAPLAPAARSVALDEIRDVALSRVAPAIMEPEIVESEAAVVGIDPSMRAQVAPPLLRAAMMAGLDRPSLPVVTPRPEMIASGTQERDEPLLAGVLPQPISRPDMAVDAVQSPVDEAPEADTIVTALVVEAVEIPRPLPRQAGLDGHAGPVKSAMETDGSRAGDQGATEISLVASAPELGDDAEPKKDAGAGSQVDPASVEKRDADQPHEGPVPSLRHRAFAGLSLGQVTKASELPLALSEAVETEGVQDVAEVELHPAPLVFARPDVMAEMRAVAELRLDERPVDEDVTAEAAVSEEKVTDLPSQEVILVEAELAEDDAPSQAAPDLAVARVVSVETHGPEWMLPQVPKVITDVLAPAPIPSPAAPLWSLLPEASNMPGAPVSRLALVAALDAARAEEIRLFAETRNRPTVTAEIVDLAEVAVDIPELDLPKASDEVRIATRQPTARLAMRLDEVTRSAALPFLEQNATPHRPIALATSHAVLDAPSRVADAIRANLLPRATADARPVLPAARLLAQAPEAPDRMIAALAPLPPQRPLSIDIAAAPKLASVSTETIDALVLPGRESIAMAVPMVATLPSVIAADHVIAPLDATPAQVMVADLLIAPELPEVVLLAEQELILPASHPDTSPVMAALMVAPVRSGAFSDEAWQVAAIDPLPQIPTPMSRVALASVAPEAMKLVTSDMRTDALVSVSWDAPVTVRAAEQGPDILPAVAMGEDLPEFEISPLPRPAEVSPMVAVAALSAPMIDEAAALVVSAGGASRVEPVASSRKIARAVPVEVPDTVGIDIAAMTPPALPVELPAEPVVIASIAPTTHASGRVALPGSDERPALQRGTHVATSKESPRDGFEVRIVAESVPLSDLQIASAPNVKVDLLGSVRFDDQFAVPASRNFFGGRSAGRLQKLPAGRPDLSDYLRKGRAVAAAAAPGLGRAGEGSIEVAQVPGHLAAPEAPTATAQASMDRLGELLDDAEARDAATPAPTPEEDVPFGFIGDSAAGEASGADPAAAVDGDVGSDVEAVFGPEEQGTLGKVVEGASAVVRDAASGAAAEVEAQADDLLRRLRAGEQVSGQVDVMPEATQEQSAAGDVQARPEPIVLTPEMRVMPESPAVSAPVSPVAPSQGSARSAMDILGEIAAAREAEAAQGASADQPQEIQPQLRTEPQISVPAAPLAHGPSTPEIIAGGQRIMGPSTAERAPQVAPQAQPQQRMAPPSAAESFDVMDLRLELSYVYSRDAVRQRVAELKAFFPPVMLAKGRFFGASVPGAPGRYVVGFEANDIQARDDMVWYLEQMGVPFAFSSGAVHR